MTGVGKAPTDWGPRLSGIASLRVCQTRVSEFQAFWVSKGETRGFRVSEFQGLWVSTRGTRGLGFQSFRRLGFLKGNQKFRV